LLESPPFCEAPPLADATSAVVPARNTILVSYAAALASICGAREIWIGCCAADAAAFPDCRPAWIAAMTTVLSLGVNADLVLTAPLVDRTKAQAIREARDAGGIMWASVARSWSCYAPTRDLRPCGECAACVARARGFAEAGEIDPALGAA
jgi:7-cyano-7-deazaguanine synthase